MARTHVKITHRLELEHEVFLTVFDRVEQLLPEVTTLAEIRLLTTSIEGLLEKHGDQERNLAYLALDHVLEERDHLDRLHQDHQEIDTQLRRVGAAGDVSLAKHFLSAALKSSREHFRREELTVFPLMEQVLSSHTLTVLEGSLRDRQEPPAN